MKYKLTTKTKVIDGVTLHQIKALVDIPYHNVNKGDLGGWIEKEKNLKQTGNAWIFGDAQVYEDARVYGKARVCGNAKVYGDAQVYGNAWVSGNAKVYEDARVYGDAEVYNDAQVFGDAKVYGNAQVFGHAQVFFDAKVYGKARVYGHAEVYNDAQVFGDAWVSGNAWICGDAILKKTKDYICIGPVGNDRFITYTKSNEIVVAGCFYGTLGEFKKAVKNKYGKVSDYYPVIKLLKDLEKSKI